MNRADSSATSVDSAVRDRNEALSFFWTWVSFPWKDPPIPPARSAIIASATIVKISGVLRGGGVGPSSP